MSPDSCLLYSFPFMLYFRTVAEQKAKNTGLITVLWCNTCGKRPGFLIKGYRCPDCNSDTVKKDIPKEQAYAKKDEPENDSLAWLEG